MKSEVKLPELTRGDDFCSKIQISIFSKYFHLAVENLRCSVYLKGLSEATSTNNQFAIFILNSPPSADPD
jgi:hypothetical protein